MFTIHRQTLQWGGKELTLETGHMARQADGAVVARYGDTVVLCTVVAEKEAKEDAGFFPLTVHYQEKFYAAGRIPGGFFKREGRPSEFETLTSRLIDRPLRPLFPKGFRNETQIICTVLSQGDDDTADVVSLIGASAAVAVAGLPVKEVVAAARVGLIDGALVLNPSLKAMEASKLNLLVAGTESGVIMVESAACELTEDQMQEAVEFGCQAFQDVIKCIKTLQDMVSPPVWELPSVENKDQALSRVRELVESDVRAAYEITDKAKRREALSCVKKTVVDACDETHTADSLLAAFEELESDVVRNKVLSTGVRIDGRDTKTVRPITPEVDVLPKTHGSALFTRGETQALVVLTLGTGDDEQMIDSVMGEYKENIMLHYNFPPFSVGEARRLAGPGRREIGHGRLALRAIQALLPSKESFPYTLRLVSEVLESNGSSSMATVCGASLAMMDAGIPLREHVAGVAMGLIKEGDNSVILTDILGDEDHLGDMDFKVAGTEKGVTALQMDLKIPGIAASLFRKALAQARDGRLHILQEMKTVIAEPRQSFKESAPRMHVMSIPKAKIRDVIGSGGKVIRDICDTSGAKIDISDDGEVRIFGPSQNSIKIASDYVKSLTEEVEVDKVYVGKVAKVVDFGAFVNFASTYGLVHISELADDRVEKTTDVVNVGDSVKVKVLKIDKSGKISLSMRNTV